MKILSHPREKIYRKALKKAAHDLDEIRADFELTDGEYSRMVMAIAMDEWEENMKRTIRDERGPEDLPIPQRLE